MKQREEAIKLTEQTLKNYDAAGAIVAIAEDGEMAYKKGFGYRNIAESLVVDEETVFGLASISKVFTSVAIMHLQENGKLSVDDPIILHIPEFHVNDQELRSQITIHHFLTHSSGLPPMSSLEYAMKVTDGDNAPTHFGSNKDQPLLDTYEQMLDFMREQDVDLIAPPGTHFSYSNEGYGLLGLIVERTSGKSYKQYVHDHIVEPSQMKHTHFTIEDYGDYDNITVSYGNQKADGKSFIGPDKHWVESVPMRSTGFVKSTAADMMRFAEIFRNEGRVGDAQIISKESVEQMMTTHVRVQLGRYYGYGLSIVPDYYGDKLVGHGGSLRSISSQLSIIPAKGISGIFVSNVIGVPVDSLLQKFLNTYAGRDMNASYTNHEEYDVDLETMGTYTGKYASDEGASIELQIQDGKFVFIDGKEVSSTMFVRENIFLVYFKDDQSLIEVLHDEENKPYAISYNTRIVRKRD